MTSSRGLLREERDNERDVLSLSLQTSCLFFSLFFTRSRYEETVCLLFMCSTARTFSYYVRLSGDHHQTQQRSKIAAPPSLLVVTGILTFRTQFAIAVVIEITFGARSQHSIPPRNKIWRARYPTVLPEFRVLYRGANTPKFTLHPTWPKNVRPTCILSFL